MKIIVDEMPKYPSDCSLSRLRHGDWVCSKYKGCICNIDTCDLLIPITKFHAVDPSGSMSNHYDITFK